jgi:hypothetical protein
VRSAGCCALLSLGVAAAHAACGDATTDLSPGGEAFALADSAGIAIARNLAPPSDTLRIAEPAVRIGMVDGPEAYLFELISDVQPLPHGRVAVIDNRGARVALFDVDGRWIRDVGGRGDGPGEYRTPLRAWLEEGDLVVLDFIPRRLLRFDGDGHFLGGERVEWKNAPSPLHHTGNGWIDEREWGQHPGDERQAGGALVRIGPEGEVIDTIVGSYPLPQIGYEMDAQGRMAMVNPPTFSASPSWAAHRDRIYWTPGDEPRIEVRGADGRLERIVHLHSDGAAVTEADRAGWRTAMQERWGVPADALADAEFAERRPAVTALVAAGDGRLWASAFDPAALSGEPGRGWYVLDDDGRVVRRVVFPPGFRLMRVQEGLANGVAVTPEGVEVVEVYEVEG